MVGDARQVALPASPGDLIHADRDQAAQAALVEVVGDDALHDPPDRVPGDPQQPGERSLGHLLRKPRNDVLEVAGVGRIGPRPRHGLVAHTAVPTPQPPQLALDYAAARAEIEVTPALHSPAVDAAAELAAARADTPPPPQTDGHDHPLGAETNIDHRRPGQAEHPVECARDAHVALPRKPLNR